MKKSRIKAYLAFLICAALLTQVTGYAQNTESEVAVEFIPGTGPTYPVHPEFPDTPGNDEGVVGSLAIVSVSFFDFGKLPVSAESRLFEITTEMPNIQVVDLRGTAAGWKVSANVSRFYSDTDPTLPGAAIHIINGRPNSVSAVPAPSQIPNVLLTTDGETVPVVKAVSGAGTGHWVMRWYPEEEPEEESPYIKLEIPAGSATTGNHTATINWILEITP